MIMHEEFCGLDVLRRGLVCIPNINFYMTEEFPYNLEYYVPEVLWKQTSISANSYQFMFSFASNLILFLVSTKSVPLVKSA